MNTRLVRTVVALMGVAVLGIAGTACELLVELDRSVVVAGGDGGCPICTNVPEASDESSDEVDLTEAGLDATQREAGPDTSTTESAAGE
jgi:hypothetical protein